MKVEMLEAFLTGHPDIDDDHRQLVEMINLVSDAIESNELNQCRKLLDSFVEVARNHFAREEVILREVGFPGVEEHCIYHNGLLERADAVKRLCQEMADQGQLKECFDQMAGFFIDDVVKGDHIFVSYLVSAGVGKRL